MGKVTNLKIPVVFSKKLCWQPPFFDLMAKFVNSKAISDKYLLAWRAGQPFFILILLFVMAFSWKPFARFYNIGPHDIGPYCQFYNRP